MKKRILFVLTLLVAFFGFMGLSVRNQQVEVYAAGNQDSTDYDLQVVLNNIPDTAILSFPVTYESVYGNVISFAVEEGQNAIIYDQEAHWMVVDRRYGTDVTITVTVKGEGEAVATGSKEVSVPVGTTVTRSFTIAYNYGYENPVELENPKTSYQLGEASFELAEPTRSGYLFAGWYEGDTRVNKILVGSMKNYVLTARWTKMSFDETHVSFVENPNYTYDGTPKEPEVQVQNPYSEGTLTKGVDYTVSYNNNINATTEESKATVTISGNGEYAGSVLLEFEIAQRALTITINDDTKVYGDVDPEFSYDVEGLASVDATANLGIYREEGNDVATYKIKSSYENNNYAITVYEGEFTITKATLTFTQKTSKTYNLGITPTWSFEDYNSVGFKYEDDASALTGHITATYYKNSVENNLTEAGTYVVKFNGVSSNNYNIVFEDGTIEVVVADVNFVPAKTYTYNGSTQSLEVIAKDSSSQTINDGTFTYTNNEHKDANAEGEFYSVGVRFEHPEYGIVEQTVEIQIEKAILNITTTAQSKTYGSTEPTDPYFNAEGLQGSDNLDNLWVSRVSGENVGTYTVTLNIPTDFSNNYIISGPLTTTLTITKFDLTINAEEKNIIYGEAQPSKLSYFSANLVNGDTISVEWISVDSGNNVGTYNVTLNTSVLEENYNILGTTSTTLTIGKKTLTIAIENIQKTYGDIDPSYVYTVTGLVYDEILDINGFSRSEGENVGNYAISYNVSKMPNYDVNYNGDAVLTINPKNLEFNDVKIVLDCHDHYIGNSMSLKPGVTVTYGEQNVPCTIDYLNNTGVGTATINIEFGGNFIGNVTITYEITELPKAQEDAKAIEVEMNGVTSVSNGQQLLEGNYKSTINWISSNTGVTVVDGIVQVNEAMLNGSTVTLTAIVSFENGADICEFTVTVATEKQSMTDADTNVRIENFPSDVQLEVEDVTVSEGGNYFITNEELVKAYDIKFNDGSVKSFDSSVIVKLPVPEGEDANNLKVYHILSLDPYAYEIVNNVNVEDNYLVFEANSFSPYVIVKTCEHDYKEVITEPTCSAVGFTTHTCLICKHSYTDTETQKLAHTEEIDAAVEPTCTETGLTVGSHCKVCNEILNKQTVIEKLGHTEVIDNAIDATCIEPGITEGKHCSVCNLVITAQKEVAAKGHNFANNFCTRCDDYKASEGLIFELLEDDTYAVKSIGDCADTRLFIPSEYEGKTVTQISDLSFKGNSKLTYIFVPNTIKSINSSAFNGCYNITDIVFEDNSSLETINEMAFYECNYLTSITIPNSVIIIGKQAFYNLFRLEEVTFEENSKLKTIEYRAFESCEKLQTFIMPNTVDTLASEVFDDCTSLKNFSLSTSLTTINDCFRNCTNLTNIIIPTGVKTIKNAAFYGCTNLVTLFVPITVQSIGENALSNCSNVVVTFDGSESVWKSIAPKTGYCGKGKIFNYNDPTYTWSADFTEVTAIYEHKTNSELNISETVNSVYVEETTPTCQAVGSAKYVAQFNNTFFTEQTSQTIELSIVEHKVENDICIFCQSSVSYIIYNADFSNFAQNTQYANRESNGWVATNSAILVGGTSDSNPVFKFIGENNTVKAVTLNGKTTAYGTLTSPTLTGGIQSISFNYGYAFADKNGVNIDIMITEISTGNQYVINFVKSKNDITQKTAYLAEISLETQIIGDFKIVFTNNCPSKKTDNADRISIWNISYESLNYTINSNPVHDHVECSTCGLCTDENCDGTMNKCECIIGDDIVERTITVSSNDNNAGTVSTSEEKVNNGSTIILTFTPSEGYEASLMCINGQEQSIKGLNSKSILVTEDLVIIVIFEKIDNNDEIEDISATISFADANYRTTYSNEQQIWSQNDIILTNDKNSSTTNVGDYVNPARFYKGSSIKIDVNGLITKIYISGSGKEEYLTPWEATIKGAYGDNVSIVIKDGICEVLFNTPIEDFMVTASAQVRCGLINVYYRPN